MTMSQQTAIVQNISDRQRTNGHQKIQGVTTAVQPAAESRGPGRPTKFTPERMLQITNLVERGKTREEIAEIIGVTTGTLQVTCSKLGISLRRPKFDTGTGLLRLRQSRSHTAASPIQPSSHRENMMTEPANGYQPVSEAKPMEEAELATLHRETRQERSNGRASAAFAIRMEYKGEERSTKIPLDHEMIRQLAMEAEFQGMRIGELVAALILAITRKDLFQLVLANAPEQLRVGVAANSPEIKKE
jgi:transcription initiation factor TFIIIB Brf1 subunit/transcription initiation factor TFIIB